MKIIRIDQEAGTKVVSQVQLHHNRETKDLTALQVVLVEDLVVPTVDLGTLELVAED